MGKKTSYDRNEGVDEKRIKDLLRSPVLFVYQQIEREFHVKRNLWYFYLKMQISKLSLDFDSG